MRKFQLRFSLLFQFFALCAPALQLLAVRSGAQMHNSGIYYQKLNLIIIQYFLFQMGVHQEENEKRDEVI